MSKDLTRRGVLLGGCLVLCGACATSPERFERLPEGATGPANDRACDHDLCKLWRPDPLATPQPPTQGEPRIGRCSVGLPEDL